MRLTGNEKLGVRGAMQPIIPYQLHSLKLTFSPLNMDDWKMKFLLGLGLFSGAFAVSFREWNPHLAEQKSPPPLHRAAVWIASLYAMLREGCAGTLRGPLVCRLVVIINLASSCSVHTHTHAKTHALQKQQFDF